MISLGHDYLNPSQTWNCQLCILFDWRAECDQMMVMWLFSLSTIDGLTWKHILRSSYRVIWNATYSCRPAYIDKDLAINTYTILVSRIYWCSPRRGHKFRWPYACTYAYTYTCMVWIATHWNTTVVTVRGGQDTSRLPPHPQSAASGMLVDPEQLDWL